RGGCDLSSGNCHLRCRRGTDRQAQRPPRARRGGGMRQLRGRTFAAAGLVGLLSASTAHAEAAKAAIELTSAAVEVTVTLDEGIRANTPLADHLLADSKSWAKRQYDGANKEQKASPDLFANGRSWFYQRQYT